MEMDPPESASEVKRWLRELRQRRGMTQRELATEMGTTTRTVMNAEAEGEGLPRGLPFLRMLTALGAIREVPLEPASVADRLEALEARVEESAETTAEALDRIGGAIARLEDELRGGGDQARKEAP